MIEKYFISLFGNIYKKYFKYSKSIFIKNILLVFFICFKN